MIWYLLYPLRGTTDAPVLAPTHPLCRAFTRYGRYVARHVLATLLISVALAVFFVYPCPFLYTTDFVNGASNLPHHVWTDAKPVHRATGLEPDVVMRSIWIHGSYMQALDRDVLLRALELQDQFLGPTENFNPRQPTNTVELADKTADLVPEDRDTFHVINGLTDQSWFFHSPLLYWACSAENIANDPDIVKTVNERKTQSTSVNVTLRHSIVFSGKRFEDRRLVAADALVITLIHLRDSPVGRQWERRASALSALASEKWTVIPSDGRPPPSQVYEFQFKPLSIVDRVLLTLAYLLCLGYIVSSYSKLRAVKSRFGLLLAAWVQIVASMVSSLTVCAVFKVDLSRLPYAAYPLVVLAVSLENSFRLINAVIMAPTDHSIAYRIGQAFGETAHVAVASRAQNLIILWGLYKITLPGVSAFCTFAGVAILFDFFYLSTFFLSVLSIDVRRTELSDALEKASSKRKASAPRAQTRHSWADTLFQSRVALLTRIAGTVIMLGFVLIAEAHFLHGDNPLSGFITGALSTAKRAKQQADPRSSLLIDIHQARSPTSWLRLQDHETARQVINVVKPWAHSYTARVYDPLIFVLRGSDRIPHSREPLLLPAAYDFIHHELPRFVVVVLMTVVLVRLLMNYLLWDELADTKEDDFTDSGPNLSMRSLDSGHALDIALMTASSDGHLVSVGLDRIIQVWDIRSGSRSRVLSNPKDPLQDPFPVLAAAVDTSSSWLALLSPRRAMLWNLAEKRRGPSVDVDMDGHKPVLFSFDSRTPSDALVLVAVKRGGTMVELDLVTGECKEYPVCRSPLVSAILVKEEAGRTVSSRSSIVTLSRRSCVHKVVYRNDAWLSESIKLPSYDERGPIQSLQAISTCSAYLVARQSAIDLVDLATSQVVQSFETEPHQPRSLKVLRSRPRQTPCGLQGLSSITLAYLRAETGECVLQTYLPQEEGDVVCICHPPGSNSTGCCLWADTRESRRRVEDPGDWEVLANGSSIIGVRRRTTDKGKQYDVSPLRNGLRRRHHRCERQRCASWEVWVISQFEKADDYEVMPLADLENGEPGGEHLMISKPGPMVGIGSGSVAVGFGNVIKVITVGNERFNGLADRFASEDLSNLVIRRRKTAGGLRVRPPGLLDY